MKPTLILLMLTLCWCASVDLRAQGWEAVNSPFEDNISGIFFVHPDTLFITTATGKVGRSFDAGRTWDTFDAAPGVSLEDLYFLNAGTGFACGTKGTLLRTDDGGYTWGKTKIGDTLNLFFDVEFFDGRNGLLAGWTGSSQSPYGGLAYRTSDGGQSWQKIETLGLGYSKIFYPGQKRIHLLSYGRLNYSEDWGRSWKSRTTVDGQPGRTFCIYGRTGIMGGLGGMCAISNDSGRTWTPVVQDKQTLFIASQLVDEKVGYLGGTKSTLLKTSDGGKNWTPELMVKSFDIFDMFLIEDQLYVVGAGGGIIRKKVK